MTPNFHGKFSTHGYIYSRNWIVIWNYGLRIKARLVSADRIHEQQLHQYFPVDLEWTREGVRYHWKYFDVRFPTGNPGPNMIPWSRTYRFQTRSQDLKENLRVLNEISVSKGELPGSHTNLRVLNEISGFKGEPPGSW